MVRCAAHQGAGLVLGVAVKVSKSVERGIEPVRRSFGGDSEESEDRHQHRHDDGERHDRHDLEVTATHHAASSPC